MIGNLFNIWCLTTCLHSYCFLFCFVRNYRVSLNLLYCSGRLSRSVLFFASTSQECCDYRLSPSPVSQFTWYSTQVFEYDRHTYCQPSHQAQDVLQSLIFLDIYFMRNCIPSSDSVLLSVPVRLLASIVSWVPFSFLDMLSQWQSLFQTYQCHQVLC